MRKLILLSVFFVSMMAYSQSDTPLQRKGIKPKLTINDSTITKLKQLEDSVAKQIEAKQREESINQNVNYILELNKERKAKEKRNTLIRIGIGIAFLIVLIIGLRRRRVKK